MFPSKELLKLRNLLAKIRPRKVCNLGGNYAGFRLACRSPLCRAIIDCCFRVNSSQRPRHFGFIIEQHHSQVDQLSVVCRCGQSSGVIDLLARCCLPLCHPSGKWGLRSCTKIIIKAANSSNAASGKQHYALSNKRN